MELNGEFSIKPCLIAGGYGNLFGYNWDVMTIMISHHLNRNYVIPKYVELKSVAQTAHTMHGSEF